MDCPNACSRCYIVCTSTGAWAWRVVVSEINTHILYVYFYYVLLKFCVPELHHQLKLETVHSHVCMVGNC